MDKAEGIKPSGYFYTENGAKMPLKPKVPCEHPGCPERVILGQKQLATIM